MSITQAQKEALAKWYQDPIHSVGGVDFLLDEYAILYAIQYTTKDMYTRNPVYAIAPDPNKIIGCVICLCMWMDGTPVAVRYPTSDIKMIESDLDIRMNKYLHDTFRGRKYETAH